MMPDLLRRPLGYFWDRFGSSFTIVALVSLSG
jgi:hypothetical protein